ncbi:MAG: cobyrinate a,c-diamide synthase [Proteobacteria bacterium]|nr:cobyrinate a,c-diamide synthase [Pseudomonadota bacterium]
MVKGLIITAPKSGTGKTIATLAIMRMLTDKGIRVAPFKIGPDFIDTSHYNYVCGVSGRNLDSYMMEDNFLLWNVKRGLKNRDCMIVEGVMGLFDGFGDEGRGSTAEVAKKLNLPVVLVIDAKGSSQSILPLIYGFINWDKDLKLHGVILNRVNSSEHYNTLKGKIENMGIKCLGYLPNIKELSIGERHLGLKMGFERNEKLDEGLKIVQKYLDFQKIFSLIENSGTKIEEINLPKERDYPLDIYIAKDKAFSFIYQEHIDIFNYYGTRLHFVSPIEDKEVGLPDLFYIPGGYPELYSQELSINESFIENLQELSKRGIHIFGECGGLIYLSNSIVYGDKNYKMAGIFPFTVKMEGSLKALGYVSLTVKKGNPLFEEDDVFKGHRFHYSSIDEDMFGSVQKTYLLKRKDREWEEGFTIKNTLASYVHLHFGSNIRGFVRMLDRLITIKERAKGLKEFI